MSQWSTQLFRFIKSYPAYLQPMSLRHNSSFKGIRRAILYVPGDDRRKIKKSILLNVDAIAFDCEDGVSINQKSSARHTIQKFFNGDLPDIQMDKHSRAEWGVRINSISSGLFDDDINEIMGSERFPSTLYLPKCDSTDDIKYFSNRLSKIFETRKNELKQPIKLIFFTESCKSILNLDKICEVACNLSMSTRLFLPVAIVFGSDDFCASLGAIRSNDNHEILYARQKVVLVAKAFDLQAIDMVYIQFKDIDGLTKNCIDGARLGYTGKQIIHPDQIETVQNAFLPSAEQINWAKNLVNAFNEHQKIGKGAFVYNNNMIDMPTVKQALNVLNIVDQIK